MNLDRIGKFIAIRRKEKKMTQEQLGEKLGVSDRAVSKWERGINLPEASIMVELCNILDITVNELFSGEVLENSKYISRAEENLIKLKEMESEKNKALLFLEVVIGLTCCITFLIVLFVCCFADINFIPRLILIGTAVVVFGIGIFFGMKLEREVGYYECGKCHYKYIPKVLPFWFSMHFGRTRYLKCSKCGKYSWNKKVLTK